MTWTLKRADADAGKLLKLKVIYAIAVIAALAVGIATRSYLLPILFLVVLFVSTLEFVVGKKFLLNENSAKAGATEITWSNVKSVHVLANEIYLSPFEQESKLDTFRGVKLNTQNVSKENVLEFVKERVGEDVRFLEG